MTTRRGATRAELWSTVLVLVLAAVGIVALWPHGTGSAGSGTDTTSATTAVSAASDAELAPLRAAAALGPCPGPTRDPPGGPLAGVTVRCLGAPGDVDLGAALAGRPALLNVWASWCQPCRTELPVLAAYAARPDAVPVLAVDVRDDPRSALALLRELGVTLPSVTDRDDTVRAALSVPPTLPVSYVVRADGGVARVDPPVPFGSPDDVAAAVARWR